MANKFKTREIAPDPMYDNLMLAKFVNMLMERGKKNIARKIVYGCFDIIKEKTKEEPMAVFERAIAQATPAVEVRPKRVGGATYQVPMEVPAKRGLSLAMRWIIAVAYAKKGKPMRQKLAEEIILTSKGEGEVIKKKINVHKMAEANKAFAHLNR